MATNELAAILARRRAKEGGTSESPAFDASASGGSANGNGTGSVAAPPAPAPTPVQRSSIAERIARLKQQSAAAGPAPTPVPIATSHPSWASPRPSETPGSPAPGPTPAPSPWASPTTSWSSATTNESASETASASSPSADASGAGGNRRTSNRIAQLQGSLGINVNPFRAGGPPGGFRKPSGGHRVESDGSEGTERAIMTTGDQYAHTHGTMGIRMPGMGAAIPMPGLAKAGARIPGMAGGKDDASAAESLEASHATMLRATGPKRRGPTRVPPGAFRLPGAAGPATPAVDEAEAPAVESAAPVAAPAPNHESEAIAGELIGAQTLHVASSSGDLFGASTTPAPASEPVQLPAQPPAQLFESPKPVATLMQAEPTSTPTLFASEPSVAASFSNLSVSDSTIASAQLFGEALPSPVAPASPVVASPAPPVAHTPTPAPAPPPAPASEATPTPIAAPVASAPARRASLFGSGSAVNDDSSDSEWSDDESGKTKPQDSLFGGAAPAQTPVAPVPVATPAASSAQPHHIPSSSLFSGSDDHEGLFGGSPTAAPPASAVAPAPVSKHMPVAASPPVSSPAPPVAHSESSNNLFGAPAGTAASIPPPQQYNSLFGPGDDDDSDESDDEGGLFGTGLPTSR